MQGAEVFNQQGLCDCFGFSRHTVNDALCGREQLLLADPQPVN
jgi:hypothetical protein